MDRSEVYTEFNKIREALRNLRGFVSSNNIIPDDGIASYCYGIAQVRLNDLDEAFTRAQVSISQLADVKNGR